MEPEGGGFGPEISTLPPEMQQQVMSFMEPEMLLELRGTSSEMRFQVDDYVQHLIDSGQLTDETGNDLRGGGLEPIEALQGWANNQFGTEQFPVVNPAQPPAVGDVAAIQERFDGTFGVYPSDANYQQGLVDVYDRIIQEGGPRAQEVQDQMRTYIRTLLDEGRLTDLDGEPLPDDTTVDQAWNLWRNGNARWRSP